MAAPTLISYTETASWSTNGTPKTIASISWQTGDVVVYLSGDEGAFSETLGVPTVSGLTFTSQKSIAAPSHCAAQVAAAVAGSSGSGVISGTNSSAVARWGFGVWVFRGSAGIGNSASTASPSSTKTVSLTPTAADGAIVWAVFDWSATAVTGISITPTPSNTRQNTVFGTFYTGYIADLADQSSAGATSYGISGGSGTGPFSIVALEIKAGVSTNTDPPFQINTSIPQGYLPQVVNQ